MRELAARAQADGINYRNWAEREMKRLKAYGSERAVLAMLPVFDNLERALGSAESIPPRSRKAYAWSGSSSPTRSKILA